VADHFRVEASIRTFAPARAGSHRTAESLADHLRVRRSEEEWSGNKERDSSLQEISTITISAASWLIDEMRRGIIPRNVRGVLAISR